MLIEAIVFNLITVLTLITMSCTTNIGSYRPNSLVEKNCDNSITKVDWIILNYSPKSSMQIGPGALGLKLLVYFKNPLDMKKISDITLSFMNVPAKKWHLVGNPYVVIHDDMLDIRLFNDNEMKNYFDIGTLQICLVLQLQATVYLTAELSYVDGGKTITVKKIRTEDEPNDTPDNSVCTALTRATEVTAVKMDQNRMFIQFQPNDQRTANGQILFFDKNHTHIGYTNYLISKTNDLPHTRLIKNSNLEKGKICELIVSNNDITYINQKTFTDIDTVAIFLTDTQSKPNCFRFASISEDAAYER